VGVGVVALAAVLSSFTHQQVVHGTEPVTADYSKYPIYEKGHFLLADVSARGPTAGAGLEFGYEFDRIGAGWNFGYTGPALPDVVETKIGKKPSAQFLWPFRWLLHFVCVEMAVENPCHPTIGDTTMDIAGGLGDATPGAGSLVPMVRNPVASNHFQAGQPSPCIFGNRVAETLRQSIGGGTAVSLGGNQCLPRPMSKRNWLPGQYYQFRAGYLRKVAKIPVLLW